MIESYVIDEIKRRTSLRALAEEAGAVFKKDSAPCPLHGGDNPTAFHLYDHETRWRCFTQCPEDRNGGDVIAFYQYWKGCTFVEAVEALAARAGVVVQTDDTPEHSAPAPPPVPAPTPLESPQDPPNAAWQARGAAFVAWAEEQLWAPDGAVARAYLEERGLNEATIRRWRLGWNPRYWKLPSAQWGDTDVDPIWLHPGIVIPHTEGATLWGIKIRVFAEGQPEGRKGRKYRGPRGGRGRGILYGRPAFRGLPVLLLTEGEFDVHLAWQEGGDLCDVGTLAGARKRLHPRAMGVLLRYPAALAVVDDDEAGAQGRAYLAQVPRIVTCLPPDHDLTDYHQHGGHLRGWIAGVVAAQMERLLEQLDAARHPQTYQQWLAHYQKAAEEEHREYHPVSQA